MCLVVVFVPRLVAVVLDVELVGVVDADADADAEADEAEELEEEVDELRATVEDDKGEVCNEPLTFAI